MGEETVAELVEDARQGSSDARDELVRRHYRDVAVVAMSIVNDPAEAQDLSQEAFIRAFRNLDLLIDPARFGAWLRRIAVGVSIDWLRSFRPDLYRGWDGGDDQSPPSREPSPLQLVLDSEMVARVSNALAALPPRYRVPIRLYHLDGLSHAKIAETLGIPVATVRSLVARARKKLAPMLAEYAPDAAQQIEAVFEEQSMSETPSAAFLHVANGHSVTMTLEAGGMPGRTSIWADVLHEGPVPGDLTDDELIEVRARQLSISGDHVYDDVQAGLRGWRGVIADHQSYGELVLWFEHDLFDQLNLIQLLSFIHAHVPASKPVSLICIGSFPGRPDFKGLGELNADELASLLGTRQAVNEAQYALAEEAWRAFRSPTPEAIEAFLRTDTSALPFLSAALARFLQEYPWTRDGLARSERRLLQLAADGPMTLNEIFPRMHQEETYFTTDLRLAEMAQTFANTSPPLLSFTRRDGERLFRGVVEITDAGCEVLKGTRDRVALLGFDRWLGGVHLQSGAAIWRWDDEQQRVVRV
jgi:RNA polymerase sigma factor (sigma-70 family)